MLFPTERTKQGQLRFPGSEVSSLAPYRVCVHQIPKISIKLSPAGASQLLRKRRKINESNPISWLVTSAASPLSWGMRGSSASPSCPCSQWAQNAAGFYQGTKDFFFFFLVTLLCPAHCPRGKCPPSCLCSSHNLCFVYHHINIYNSEAPVVPSTNRKGCS